MSGRFDQSNFLYITDSSPCPNWYVVFYYLKGYSSSDNACSLSPVCLPQNYTKNWACQSSSNYVCSLVAQAVLPATVGDTSPSITITQPSPTVTTTIPQDVDLIGIDNTWCSDSDDGSYITPNATCTDSLGTYDDYCDGDTSKENYCTGTWDGKNWSNVHCATGGYVCPNGCDLAACK